MHWQYYDTLAVAGLSFDFLNLIIMSTSEIVGSLQNPRDDDYKHEYLIVGQVFLNYN